MNKRWLHFVCIIGLVVLLPCLFLAFFTSVLRRSESPPADQETKTETTPLNTEQDPLEQLRIRVKQADDSVEEMPLEEYVLGVVLAEMPQWFESDALKAQAVVARTYTLRRVEGNSKHLDAAVCTDPSCCQGFRTERAYFEDGGTTADLLKIRKAVRDTENQVLTYQGELIEATYFSCSGGMTEDAEAVWGEDIPYLQSTPSPGEENAAHHMDREYFTKEELENILQIKLGQDSSRWFTDITYTAGRGIATIQVGSEIFSGTKLRQALGLRSTAFSVTVVDNTVIFTTMGYGHRVGMSQYGADAMALAGSDYKEILSHYYRGTVLTTQEQLS